MGNNIFDWDEDEDEKEEDRGGHFQQPVQSVDYWAQNEQNTYPSSPWDETATERQFEEDPVQYLPYQPESLDETARRGGLAWSAGIVFFSSIVFMLFLGWGADLFFRSSPWGIIGGIILGSIIGFIQFFRISSQIFNTEKAESAMRPLMQNDDEKQ